MEELVLSVDGADWQAEVAASSGASTMIGEGTVIVSLIPPAPQAVATRDEVRILDFTTLLLAARPDLQQSARDEDIANRAK